MSVRRLRTSTAGVAALLLPALGLAVLPAAGPPPVQARAAESATGDVTTRTTTPLPGTGPPPARVDLPDEAHGQRALRLLGDQVSEAARLNGLGPGRLRELLASDPSAWLATSGLLHYKDPVPAGIDTPAPSPDPSDQSDPSPEPAPRLQQGGTDSQDGEMLVASQALTDTFRLHSSPGSARTIFLDFDGHTVSDTYWNTGYGVSAGPHPAWTLDGDPSTFSDSERAAVQSIWQRVAEDYAPFDVDVTTQAPPEEALLRSSSTDPTYGTRVLISPSTQAASAICSSSCGGVAFVGVFDETTSRPAHQPAWVFPQLLGNGTKAIAEAASHETGHNLALAHDGDAASAYYAGHGTWAPIMGSSYRKPVTQWSRGDYPGATNLQDDLAVIAAHGAPPRADEAGSTVETAAARSGSGAGYITSDEDVDVYAVGRCEGTLSVSVRPAEVSPDLDLRLRLLDATGSVVTAADPPSALGTPSYDVATGMDAALLLTNASDTYFVAVDGVGGGDPATSYGGYGSVGAYTLDPITCEAPPPALPSAPVSFAATPAPDGRSVLLQWSPPEDPGGSPITSYVVRREDTGARVTLPADTTSDLWGDLAPGSSYTFTVTALSNAGSSPPATTTTLTPTVPEPPIIGAARSGRPGGRLTAKVSWATPLSDGGSPLAAYQVTARRIRTDGSLGRRVVSPDLTVDTHRLVMTLGRGRWSFVVSARNPVGWGAASTPSARVRAR